MDGVLLEGVSGKGLLGRVDDVEAEQGMAADWQEMERRSKWHR